MHDGARFPELARSLRTLGAARDPASLAAQDAIFAPLIDARARATHVGDREAIALLRGATLASRIERAVIDAAAAGTEHAADARARAAVARELLEPIRRALASLDDHAAAASGSGLGSADWDAWLGQLRLVFARADEACIELARLLAQSPRKAEPSRWFGRRKR